MHNHPTIPITHDPPQLMNLPQQEPLLLSHSPSNPILIIYNTHHLPFDRTRKPHHPIINPKFLNHRLLSLQRLLYCKHFTQLPILPLLLIRQRQLLQ